MRGTVNDTAFANQVYTTLAVAFMMHGDMADAPDLAFKDVPRFANVASTLDSLAKNWPAECDAASITSDTRDTVNVMFLTVCGTTDPRADQLILYYEPSDTSATVVRMDIAPYGSKLYRKPVTEDRFNFQEGPTTHPERALLFNIAASLVLNWKGVPRKNRW